jgi:predicted glycoside hydrolase/deacetylase ChbG (UPF0249 family)
MNDTYLIINADDFGASTGINRGIWECHTRGVVTSTSLLVTGRAVQEAVDLSRDCPGLSVGLHWDIAGEGTRKIDRRDATAVRAAFHSQIDTFCTLMGRMPTHIDSHHHLHRTPELAPIMRALVEPLGVPLRCESAVQFVGGFYAQWEWMVTDLDHISVSALQNILHDEVQGGWTEVSCHPGYITPDFSAIYLHEREEEIRTLTNPCIRQTLDELGIQLVNYATYLTHHTPTLGV